jgi:hypothetical protein
MAKLRTILGYLAAVLSGVIMLATLPAVMFLAEPFIAASGLTVSAKFSGGQVAQTIDHGAYQTQVHEMAFEALFGESNRGFIQVDWAPPDRLPPHIDEEIDADGDSRPDFRLQVDTTGATSTMTPYASWVLDLEGTYEIRDALMVRVRLQNPR